MRQDIMVAGLLFRMEFHCSGTDNWFRDFLSCQETRVSYNIIRLSIPEESLYRQIKEKSKISKNPAFSEFSLLLGQVADRILSFKRCIFHGAAFSWNGKAYILTAPSGTGKTTQLKNWKALYGDEIQIIDGDKPVLRFMEDGSILVYPSPWSGKERWRGNPRIAYPLGGMVYLKQGKVNRIRRLSPDEAVLPVFTQVLYTGRTVTDIKLAAACVEKILEKIPVWELVNTGGLSSASMTREALEVYGKGKENEIRT
jgi:hypothetical protein